ncbi:MAG: hypothetical protein MJA84_12820, partial [Firmicutes bacterium]|nr:hypothetical protein [Bacillota bacterium]
MYEAHRQGGILRTFVIFLTRAWLINLLTEVFYRMTKNLGAAQTDMIQVNLAGVGALALPRGITLMELL